MDSHTKPLQNWVLTKNSVCLGCDFRWLNVNNECLSVDQHHTTIPFPENKWQEVTWQPNTSWPLQFQWQLQGNTVLLPELVYLTEATAFTEQLWFKALKTSVEVRLKQIQLHWWKFPTTKWCISKQRKISKHLEGQKIYFPCYGIDNHMDWMSRGRKTEVTCAKIVHFLTGNQNSLTAKASEAISTGVHPAQLGAPLALPNSLCQYGIFWNMRYLSTEKNVMYNQWLKS